MLGIADERSEFRRNVTRYGGRVNELFQLKRLQPAKAIANDVEQHHALCWIAA